jgi:dTDP-4-dehydrorhamnose reductase
MKVLFFGANGLIGANCIYSLTACSNRFWDITAVIRPGSIHNFKKNNIKSIEVEDICKSFKKVIIDTNPDIIVNCAGVVKQNFDKYPKSEIIRMNSLFPHLLSEYCESKLIKLITISTDCVFSIKSGNNSEISQKFSQDLYGASKRIGEVSGNFSKTIRLSSIGFEHGVSKHGLLEWLLNNDCRAVLGYSNAIYSGVAASEMFRIIEWVLDNWETSDVFHFPGYLISKLKLLTLLVEAFDLDVIIKPSSEPKIERNLTSNFVSALDLKLPPWDLQIQNLRELEKYYV